MSDIEVIARGVCIHEGHLLICRNLKHGYAYLPGGHVDFREPARLALAREFLEEAEAKVAVGTCVLVTEGAFAAKKLHHELNLVFLVELENHEDVRSVEPGIGFEWVDLASVVDLDLRPAAIKAWLMTARPSQDVEWISEIPHSD